MWSIACEINRTQWHVSSRLVSKLVEIMCDICQWDCYVWCYDTEMTPLELYREHLTVRAHTHFFSLRVSHRTHAHSAWLKLFRWKASASSFLCSLPSRSLMSLLNVPCRPFPQVLSSPAGSLSTIQRPQRPWEEAVDKTLASQLAGAGCLVEWLTQLQTQVMSPTSPTSSATWTRSTRRSIFLTATTIFPVPRRRHRDLHHGGSSRVAAFKSIQQQQANSSMQSSFNVRTLNWKQMAVGSCGHPGNGGGFGERIGCNSDF